MTQQSDHEALVEAVAQTIAGEGYWLRAPECRDDFRRMARDSLTIVAKTLETVTEEMTDAAIGGDPMWSINVIPRVKSAIRRALAASPLSPGKDKP